MAAAPNKPGAVHYALIVFVMLSVTLGITTYMFYRQSTDQIVKVLDAEKKFQAANGAQKKNDDELQAARAVLGPKLEQFYDPNNAQNQATVLAVVKAELENQGKDLKGENVVDTLRKMREGYDALAADRDSKVAKLANLEKELLALKGLYQQQVDNHAAQAKSSERGKQETIGSAEEKLNAKIQENGRLKSEINVVRDELAEEKEGREKERKTLTAQIGQLQQRIDIYAEKVANMEKLSFEEADGVIRRVEHASRTVWINLGESDFLKTRMTFSVYGKDNQGVGRGAEDIKGKIEVTRIIGPHMAEARIIDEDLYRPMVSDDMIYTPIWTPGLVEKISIIGPIDLDQDGRSDREQFHQMMALAGCEIDNEVDDDGNRTPPDGKITVQTRFLVRGDIPDPTDAVNDDERARIARINGHLTEMRDEARANGVRVIKLNDFLAYIGYHTKRRTFLPGQHRPYTLKQGQTMGDRASNGNVSKVFSKVRQDKQDVSSGQTSKAFGGDK